MDPGSWVWVQSLGSGSRVQGLGSGSWVQGLGSGSRVLGLGPGSRVLGLGLGSRVLGLRSWVQGKGDIGTVSTPDSPFDPDPCQEKFDLEM